MRVPVPSVGAEPLLLHMPLIVAAVAGVSGWVGVVIGQRLGRRNNLELKTYKARACAVPEISAGMSRLERTVSVWLDPLAGRAAGERRAALEDARPLVCSLLSEIWAYTASAQSTHTPNFAFLAFCESGRSRATLP